MRLTKFVPARKSIKWLEWFITVQLDNGAKLTLGLPNSGEKDDLVLVGIDGGFFEFDLFEFWVWSNGLTNNSTIVFEVGDMDKAVDYYCRRLGFEVVSQSLGRTLIRWEAIDIELQLVCDGHRPSTLRVQTHVLENVFAHFLTVGANVSVWPNSNLETQKASFRLEDPDANVIEIEFSPKKFGRGLFEKSDTTGNSTV